MPNVIDKQNLYIYPPRAKLVVPRTDSDIFAKKGWTAQLKYNDSRCLIKIIWTDEGWDIQLWSRHNDRLKYDLPASLRDEIEQVVDMLDLDEAGWHLLDGGLLHNKHAAIHDSLVIWDILVRNSEWLLGTTYEERYNFISSPSVGEWNYISEQGSTYFGLKLTQSIFAPQNWPSETWDELWDVVETVNRPHLAMGRGPLLEGMVMKDPLGVLEMGLREHNNSSWMARSRVSTGRHDF